MPSPTAPNSPPIDLRSRAVSMLTAQRVPASRPPSASEALKVLHDLAASPATAADALALLHELQVHQVELDLQAEALRESRAAWDEGASAVALIDRVHSRHQTGRALRVYRR